MWKLLVTDQAELCKNTWWRNFFMIHNWFGFNNICVTNSHHIGTDFYLFIAGIFLVLFLHARPKHGIILISVLGVISTIGRFHIVYVKELGIFVNFDDK